VNKILLIDDDKSFTCFFSDAIAHLGATCDVLHDSVQITEHNMQEYAHIIIDLMMPNYDGMQILGHLKAVDYKGYISVVSGQDKSVLKSAQEVCRMHQLTFHTALQKPFELKELEQLVYSSPEGNTQNLVKPPVKLLSEQEMLVALRGALRQLALDVHFQPKVSLQDNKVLGFEALARWHHNGQFIPPTCFIELAEKNELTVDLSKQIISKSLRAFSTFHHLFERPTLSINLSAIELQQRRLPELLRDLVDEFNIPHEQIILEITETVLLEKNMISLEVLTRLRLVGFKLSVDDFGTGFSSVNMLQNGPFTELKIDRSFVSAINVNEQTAIIVQSVIDMANRLNLHVVAEGIEDEQIKTTLIHMNCSIGQGFLFSKPMSAQELILWANHFERDTHTLNKEFR
jgi:EAL domain-containing protein (putative c-di-GMP-specific phosphodiesterase class I)